MVFEEKSKYVSWIGYSQEHCLINKTLRIESYLAMEINKILAVYNGVANHKITNDDLANLVYRCFVKSLEDMSEDDALNVLLNELDW